MKIYYYHSGESTELNLKQVDAKKVIDLLGGLTAGAEEIMRVYVDKEGMEELKESEAVLEIFFVDTLALTSDEIDGQQIKKLLIPLSGDYAATAESPAAAVFIGSDEYLSNPFRNANGYPIVKQIEKELQIKR